MLMVCPSCGETLELALVRSEPEETGPDHSVSLANLDQGKRHVLRFPSEITVVIKGKEYEVSQANIKEAAKAGVTGRGQKYFVELEDSQGKETYYPVWPLVKAALRRRHPGFDYPANVFTTNRARGILRRLGFQEIEKA